jgi:hypothetical protein
MEIKKVNYRMKKTMLLSSILAVMSVSMVAKAETDQQRIQNLEQKVEALVEMVESQSSSVKENKVHLGGYGEIHINQIKDESNEFRGLDFHRMVVFIGYDFSDTVRWVSEIEIEHATASASTAGMVIVEQGYLEFDFGSARDKHLKTGIILMPVGIVNETHEPAVFYGIERPIIESTILPSTWWGAGIMFTQKFNSGLSYDLFLSEGLKTRIDDPFNIKFGKQKTTSKPGDGGKAAIFDLAVTARIKYTGIAGLELSAYTQYQPDLDQSAEISYADSATMFGAHAIYQFDDFTVTGLYAGWKLDGDMAKAAEKDSQTGGYVELSYKPTEKIGVFVRQSQWQKKTDEQATQTDVGANYWPLPNVVFKADFQIMNEFAGRDTNRNILKKATAFNLGMGYHF